MFLSAVQDGMLRPTLSTAALIAVFKQVGIITIEDLIEEILQAPAPPRPTHSYGFRVGIQRVAQCNHILAHTCSRQSVLLIWAQEEILDEKDVIAAAGELTRKEEKADVARQVAGGGALPFQHPLLQYLQAKERQEATLPAAELEAIDALRKTHGAEVSPSCG